MGAVYSLKGMWKEMDAQFALDLEDAKQLCGFTNDLLSLMEKGKLIAEVARMFNPDLQNLIVVLGLGPEAQALRTSMALLCEMLRAQRL